MIRESGNRRLACNLDRTSSVDSCGLGNIGRSQTDRHFEQRGRDARRERAKESRHIPRTVISAYPETAGRNNAKKLDFVKTAWFVSPGHALSRIFLLPILVAKVFRRELSLLHQ